MSEDLMIKNIDEQILELLKIEKPTEVQLGELHDLCLQGIEHCRKQDVAIMIKAGRYYLIIHRIEVWTHDGSCAPNFDEWLKDPAHCFSYGKAQAYDCMALAWLEDLLFQKFGIVLSEHYDIGWAKFRMIKTPLKLACEADDKEQALQILRDGHQTAYELQKEYTKNPYFKGFGTLDVASNTIKNVYFADLDQMTGLDGKKVALSVRMAREQK